MSAHVDNAVFQVRVEAARRQDHDEISRTLQEIGGQNRRMEMLLVGLSEVCRERIRERHGPDLC